MTKQAQYIDNPRIVLTLDQTRELQRGEAEWPAQWAPLLAVPVPQMPNGMIDKVRSDAALFMMRLGCEDEQIVQQLHCHPGSYVMRTARRNRRIELAQTMAL